MLLVTAALLSGCDTNQVATTTATAVKHNIKRFLELAFKTMPSIEKISHFQGWFTTVSKIISNFFKNYLEVAKNKIY
jgi:hypothetical protein